jgi:hypothetical protein
MNSANAGLGSRLRTARSAAAAALLFLSGGCRLSPMSPVGTPGTALVGLAGVAAPSDVAASQPAVPTLTHLRAEVKHGVLLLTGNLAVEGWRHPPEYSASSPGGWCLQVLLNTDQQRTGYWRGYDYIVRGVEWNPESRIAVVRRITLESGYSGGWGPASGEASLRPGRVTFAVEVPLAAIGDDDGNLDFAVDTYLTVACPECESGRSQCYGATYFGTCSADGRSAVGGPFVLAAGVGTDELRPHVGPDAPRR